MLAARTAAQLEAVAAECRLAGAASVSVLPGDIAEPEGAAAVVAAAERDHGRLDAVVHAAGVYGPIGPLAGNDPAAWAEAARINLMGTVFVCQAAIPALLRAGGGSLVLLSGGGATQPLPNFSAYAASKAAVVRLAETLAEELRDAGIRVNAIAPGAVDTSLQDEVLAAGPAAGQLYERIKAMRETGAGATPPAVAAALALFLVSGRSGSLTGRLLSAPHDRWREWTPADIAGLEGTPWFTLRRIDPHTIEPLAGRKP